MDPPYDQGGHEFLLGEIGRYGLLRHDGIVVAEDRATAALPEKGGGLILADQRRYGDTGFWFYHSP